MVLFIAFAISCKEEKECLLGLRLWWKSWEAVFHRPYGCKNKWCLYKDLGSEKTVIKQELRSLSSPLLSSYGRLKLSKPFYWALVSSAIGRARQNGDMVRWSVYVCMRESLCTHAWKGGAGISVYRTETCRVVSQAWFYCPLYWQPGIFLCSSGR